MSRYLIDTNVISETASPHPDKSVMQWMDNIPLEDQFISVISLAELHKGIHKTKNAAKKQQLGKWLMGIQREFEKRIVPFDRYMAAQLGEFLAERKTLPLLDSMIAATALTNDLIVVTRNVKDFQRFDVEFIDPWNM